MPGSYPSFVQRYKIVDGIIDNGTTATITSDTVSLKNCQMCWIVVKIDPAAGTGCLITPQRATAVLPTGSAVLANVVPIWVNLDTSTSDTLVRVTDALNYTFAANATPKMVVFEIDPANLGGVYDCVNVLTGILPITDSVCVTFFLETRYPQATPPAAITD